MREKRPTYENERPLSTTQSLGASIYSHGVDLLSLRLLGAHTWSSTPHLSSLVNGGCPSWRTRSLKYESTKVHLLGTEKERQRDRERQTERKTKRQREKTEKK